MCGRLGYSWDIGVILPGLVLLLGDKTGLVLFVHGSLQDILYIPCRLSPLSTRSIPTREACLRVLSIALNMICFSSLFLSVYPSTA